MGFGLQPAVVIVLAVVLTVGAGSTFDYSLGASAPSAVGAVCDDANPCTFDVFVDPNCLNVPLPEGEACDDGLFCNGEDTCRSGNCEHSGNPCLDGDGDSDCSNACDENKDNCSKKAAAGDPCIDDGDVCTDDICDDAGVCLHIFDADNDALCFGPSTTTTLPVFAGCPEFPLASCLQAAVGQFQLRDRSGGARDALKWKWRKGEAASAECLGDPLSATGYALCLYDWVADVPYLRLELRLPAGQPWRAAGRGFKYADKRAAAGGVRGMRVVSGGDGRSNASVVATGINLALPGAVDESRYFAQDPELTIQLINSEGWCWDSRFDFSYRNKPSQFKAKYP